MSQKNPLIAILLSLCLMLGAVGQAVAQAEMAGMTDLVLCGATGQTTVTLDANGQPVQRHPCTHCLAGIGMALGPQRPVSQPPALQRAERLLHATRTPNLAATLLTPVARGPPSLRI